MPVPRRPIERFGPTCTSREATRQTHDGSALARSDFNQGCRDLCRGGMVRGARRSLARRARAGQKRRAPEDPNGQERFHGGDAQEAHTARWSVTGDGRPLGPVPQRRQAAISVDGAEPHHAEHAGQLEQQEPPVSGLPQRAQETDLGHGVVDPGGDDTEEGEAREPRQALGRLERIRPIVPGEEQGTCRGGQHQEAADPDGGGRDVQAVDELGQAEVAPGRGMPGSAVGPADREHRDQHDRRRALAGPSPKDPEPQDHHGRGAHLPHRSVMTGREHPGHERHRPEERLPAHLCGAHEEEQGRRDREPGDRGEQRQADPRPAAPAAIRAGRLIARRQHPQAPREGADDAHER